VDGSVKIGDGVNSQEFDAHQQTLKVTACWVVRAAASTSMTTCGVTDSGPPDSIKALIRRSTALPEARSDCAQAEWSA